MRDDIYFDASSPDLAAFREVIGRKLLPEDVPLASGIEKDVPFYDMSELGPSLSDRMERRALMAEWAAVLARSSGVLVLKKVYPDTDALDTATEIYSNIIEAEREHAAADHFAAAGANDRIWNSLQKLCLADARTFARLFGNDAIAAVCEAWLGPGYQMTAQVNRVRPGGKAQTAHRDYHLGFQSEAAALLYPAHVHVLSPVMTLQGAVAHCDMPLESGPTKFLPFSQMYRPGYLAYRRKEFSDFFEDNFVQLPLAKGDAIFFNPALFHGAGDNVTPDIERMANLLQVSSPFGRAMEAVDRISMCRALYPAILSLRAEGLLDEAATNAAIASAADGYSFPTNLDTDPPVGGLAPETQLQLFRRALDEGMEPSDFDAALAALDIRRQP